MVKNAETILQNNDKLFSEYVKNGYKIDANRDPRLLSFGKFMRSTSIDELPQFFNVIRSEMNVVGPRPVVEKKNWMTFMEVKKIYIYL